MNGGIRHPSLSSTDFRFVASDEGRRGVMTMNSAQASLFFSFFQNAKLPRNVK